jgi:hypothetical protein
MEKGIDKNHGDSVHLIALILSSEIHGGHGQRLEHSQELIVFEGAENTH